MRRFFAFFAAVLFTTVICLAVLLYASREMLFKIALEFAITEATGFRTEIKTLQHEWPAVFILRGVKMENPDGYKRRLFARAPYFYIEFDLPDILKRRSFHIRYWRLIVTELHLDKNRNGVLNSSLLKSIKKLGGVKQNADGTMSPGLPFRMDRLEVKIYKITYRDRTGVIPKKITTGLYLPTSVYENVTDFKKMIDEIKEKVMGLPPAPSKFMMLSPFMLESSIKKAAKAPRQVAKTPGLLKTTAHGAKEKFDEVTEATKEQLGKIMR